MASCGPIGNRPSFDVLRTTGRPIDNRPQDAILPYRSQWYMIRSTSYGGLMNRLALSASLCVLLSPPMWPQFELGSIVGVVTDPAKVAVSGATVEIRSLSTNVKREVVTSTSGEYNSLPLQPGRY